MSGQLLKRNSSSYYQTPSSIYPLYLVIYNNQKMKVTPNLMKQIFTKESFKCTSLRLHLRKWNYRIEFIFDGKESRNEGIQILKKLKDKYDFNFYYYFQRGLATYCLMEEWEYRNAINFSNTHPGFGQNDRIQTELKHFRHQKNQRALKETIEIEVTLPKNDLDPEKINQKSEILDLINIVSKSQLESQKSNCPEIQRDQKGKLQKINQQKGIALQKNMVSIIKRDDIKDPRKQIREQQAQRKKENQILLLNQKEKEKEREKEKPLEQISNTSRIQKQTPQAVQILPQKLPQLVDQASVIRQIVPQQKIVPQPEFIEVNSKDRQIQEILNNMELVQKLLRMQFMLIEYLG